MTPTIDYHALAPEIVLTATIVIVLLADVFAGDRERVLVPRLASIGVLAALIPVVTLAVDGTHRSMFHGAYVVDNYALAFKGFFLVVAYISLLLSFDYIGDGDYYQGEYYVLLLTSVLGLSVMASSRDLITIFVALETISIPTFVLAGWRKHDARSNEAAIKYFLIGVLSTGVMLYGMSLVYGLTGSTLLREIAAAVPRTDAVALLAVAMFLTLVGFAFKVSAVPFHFWVPDTYEGAPTPVTAFLSVASKAGGFVALLTVVIVAFARHGTIDAWAPVQWALWILAAASMTLGNLTALRQTNIVRMLAYSSIAQGGFILVPLAVAGNAPRSAIEAVVIYLFIYGAMNLGAFAVVIAVARKTRSGEIASYSGLGQTEPVLALVMTGFLLSLAGIPPLAGWFAKFVMFRAALDAGTAAGTTLAVIAAVNSVIAFFYYAAVVRRMWFHAPAGVASPLRTTSALAAAMAITVTIVLVVGVYPQVFAKIGELATS
ncbi:MAG: NADH-quinone oxidoreductase subunit N [Acidimicrobiia bacterium]